MCDDLVFDPKDSAWRGVDRRQFAALSTVGVLLMGCGGTVNAEGGGAVSEKMVSITTADGICDAFFVHPSRGGHPGVIMWPDIAGLRDAFKIMARSLAAAGYAVLVVNPYYRSSPAPIMESFSEYRTPDGQAKVQPMRALLDAAAITRDASAFAAYLDQQPEVDKGRGIGSNGYCMGGPFAVRAAAAVPARVKAAASLHGAGLVTDALDSPHRLLARTKARFLFAIARNDDAKQPQEKSELRRAADAAHLPAEVEVYPADHGWCVPDSPAYDPNAADKAWQRMLVLFAGL